jgi:hypothetical protein
MNLTNQVLARTAVSWTDVQKQLFSVIQTRGGGAVLNTTANPSATILINKPLVKQCTDLLIKHIKSNLRCHFFTVFVIIV